MPLSTRIACDLKKRLQSGHPMPTPLTLDALSAHYDVSVTPVRAAIAELVAEGILLKGPNRRLLAVPRTRGAAAPVEVADPFEPPRDLLRQVEHDLVRLSLGEVAVPIREEAAARKYGVSRSAMRYMLNRLAGRGLLSHIPRRGWQVRPFRQEDMESFLEVRALLEVKALELAQDRLDPTVIQGILDRNRLSAAANERPQIDNSLHEYIIAQAANPYISDIFERHGRYYEMLFEWEDLDQAAAVQAVRQHRQILEAILRCDWEAARAALDWHIRSNHPVLRDVAARATRAENLNKGSPQ